MCDNVLPFYHIDSNDDLTTKAYVNYVSVICVEDEGEDSHVLDGLEIAIKNSLVHEKENLCDVTDILKKFTVDTLQKSLSWEEESQIDVVINRSSVYKSTLRAIQRDTFSFEKPVGVTFAGEEAVDYGGPRREYFRLLMKDVGSSTLFKSQWFTHNLESLNNQEYELAGKLVAWSVLQGGPGPKNLSNNIFMLMCGYKAEYNTQELIKLVKDRKLQELLFNIEKCTSIDEFELFKKNHDDSVANYGYLNIYSASVEKKNDIIDCFLKQHFIFSVYAEIQQFRNGLNSIGKLGDIVLHNKHVFKKLLGDEPDKLTFTKFKSLYKVEFSEEGSNKRISENQTIYCFEVFLQDLSEGTIDGLALCDLLNFITGADQVPPLGFPNLIEIQFYNYSDCEKRLPWSSTCSLTLFLPRGITEETDFLLLMKRMLLECVGFGKC